MTQHAPPPRSSGAGTAITAAVLSILGAVAQVPLVGGIQRCRRRSSGRLMVIAGSAVAVALAISAWVVAAATAVWTKPASSGPGNYFGPHAVATRLFSWMPTLPMYAVPFALVTLILVLLPLTGRWCRPRSGPDRELLAA